MKPIPSKLFFRRSEAMEALALPPKEFAKLVNTEQIRPVYLNWDVLDARGRVDHTTNEAKAREYAAAHAGCRVQASGHAYFRRADLVKFVEQNGEVVK